MSSFVWLTTVRVGAEVCDAAVCDDRDTAWRAAAQMVAERASAMALDGSMREDEAREVSRLTESGDVECAAMLLRDAARRRGTSSAVEVCPIEITHA